MGFCVRALPFPLWLNLGLCCCSPLFWFLPGAVVLNPLEFCCRTIHGRSPKPSLRAARVISSRVSSFLFPLCTVYNPSFDLRACDPISTCVSNRTHAPIRSCSPVDGYWHNTSAFLVPHSRVPHGSVLLPNCLAYFDLLMGMRAVLSF